MMKRIPALTIDLLAVAVAVLSSLAAARNDSGPKMLASHFVAQFYDVPAKTVSVTLIEFSDRRASTMTKTSTGRVCTIHMVPAPDRMEAPFGWLSESLSCS
jgi:multisubunit Na+/H+ antiporter MnhB subunit